MPYRDESKLMSQDAPADASTEFRFDPPNGPFDGKSKESTVVGTLTSKYDVDWIAVELTAGKEYTISLEGMGDLTDTKVRLLSSKGGEIMALDDVDMDGDGVAESLHPTIKFTPEAGTGTQKYFIEVSAYTGNPGTNDFMTPADYLVTVNEMVVPDPTEGEGIMGTPDDPTTAVDESTTNDKLRGTDQNDMISGLGGNDSLYGLGGNDELDGGDGDDLLSGGPGADEIEGGDGTDTIAYSDSPAGVTINLSDGAARGGDADGDTIGSDIENVIGSMHDDTLTGTRGENELWGLGGNDELDGGRRNDELFGGTGDDTLDGGAGNDMLEGGAGADTLEGGDGTDTAAYTHSTMGVTVRLHNQKAMGGDAEGDIFAATVTAEYTDKDDDDREVMLPDIINLKGSANADILAGDFRNNKIEGGGGNDKIYGGPDPSDIDPMSRGLVTNNDELHGGGGDDMIFGGAGNDMLFGNAGDDMLRGGAGADTYYGGAGSDMIYADESDLTINGWVMTPVNDPLTPNVDESMEAVSDPMTADTVSYEKVEDEVVRTLNGPNGAIVAGLATITNVENIIGSQGDDTLTGSNQANVIEGGEGGDILVGGGGNDTLSYAGSDDWVRVTLGVDAAAEVTASRGHASGDTPSGFENITGSAFDDDLTGNVEVNVLKGLAGDDELVGGGGGDTLEGGAGADEMDGGVARSDDNEDDDTLSYASSDAGVIVNLATAKLSGGHAEGDTITTIETDHDLDDVDGSQVDEDDRTDDIDVSTFENVTGSMHKDTITGDYRMNVLNGMGGDDTLRGGAGSDHLIGGAGADMLDGGSSLAEGADTPSVSTDDVQHIDWAVYRGATVDKDTNAGVTVNLDSRKGESGDAEGDDLINIELVWGSMGDDVFKASEGYDWVHGDNGSYTMSYELSGMGVTVNLESDQPTAAFDNDPSVEDLGTAIDYIVDGTPLDFDGQVTEDQMEDNTNGVSRQSI